MNSLFTHSVFNAMNNQSEAIAHDDTAAAAQPTSPAPFVTKEDSGGSLVNIGGGGIESTTQPGTSTLNLESGMAQNEMFNSGTTTLVKWHNYWYLCRRMSPFRPCTLRDTIIRDTIGELVVRINRNYHTESFRNAFRIKHSTQSITISFDPNHHLVIRFDL